MASRSTQEQCAVLSLLGSWELRRDGDVVEFTTNAQRLLVLLALKGPQRRTYASAVLWPEVRDEQALTRLRCTLWRMRRQCTDLLDVGEQTVALSDAIEVDVEHLVAVAREVIEGRTRPDDLDSRCAELTAAPELLLGWYDDWVLQERGRISQLRVRALEALVDQLILVGKHSGAFEAATAAIRLDPLRESTHRAVMRVYLAEGNPALAKRQLERYRQILRAELGVDEPTSEMFQMLVRCADTPVVTTGEPSPARI
jgi:DNA-binding SARP family transcriptional activator